MSGRITLAVLAAPRLDAGVEEFVRICVGLVAARDDVALVEVGCGAGVLSACVEAPEDVERGLAGLAAFGIAPRVAEPAELRDLLARTDRLVRVAAPDRRGTPEVVVIDAAWLLHVPDPALVLAFEQAGQFIRA